MAGAPVVLLAISCMLPPATGSLGELGFCTIPPVDWLPSGPEVTFVQSQGRPWPGPPLSLVRLVKCTTWR